MLSFLSWSLGEGSISRLGGGCYWLSINVRLPKAQDETTSEMATFHASK